VILSFGSSHPHRRISAFWVVVVGFVCVVEMAGVIVDVKGDGRAVDCGVNDADYGGEPC